MKGINNRVQFPLHQTDKGPTWKIGVGQLLKFRKYLAHYWWAVEG